MIKPFDFLNAANLDPRIAAKMQAVANRRAAQGLISENGVTHRTIEAKAVYDSGKSAFSREYQAASFPKADS